MKQAFAFVLCAAGAFSLLSDQASAHGGIYRGPADTVPPGPGGGGGRSPGNPTTPGTGAPVAPGPMSPTAPGTGGAPPAPTGAPMQPGGGGGAPPGTGGGAPMEDDLTTWDFWWEFNKDSFLGLKDAVDGGGPITGDDEIWLGATRRREARGMRPTRNEASAVLPALKRALDASDNRDITSAAMIAMAKIGQDHPDFTLRSVFEPRLQRGDQEVRETAALAFGIAGQVANGELQLLASLALDDAAGRRLAGREVDTRTRSFAIYGLGLLASGHSDVAIKRAAFEPMQKVLADDTIANRNPKVAAIHGISLLGLGTTIAGERALLDEALAALDAYFARQLGPSEQLVQAHCPTAIAKLVGRSHPRAGDYANAFARELGASTKRRSHDVARSCTLALGLLCGPYDDAKSPSAAHSQLLAEVLRDHRDAQTRYFASISLARIGGSKNRITLLKALEAGNRSLEQPWYAIALGVMAHDARREQARRGEPVVEDAFLGTTLFDHLRKASNPSAVGGFAVALGLVGHKAAAPHMRERLLRDLQKESQAGYLCLGLGLMRDSGAKEDIQLALEQSSRRPDLLKQAAVALGLLGDKSASELLRKRMQNDEQNLATFASLASAIGLIGDRRSIDPLTTMLLDSKLSALPRAFAAAALGGIADRANHAWNARLAADLNYRATVETLTNQSSGILDLL